MPKKYEICLTPEERQELGDIVGKNKANRAKIINAFVLLRSDSGAQGENWTDEAISTSYKVSVSKIERLRERFVEEGMESTLSRKAGSGGNRRKIFGDEQAHLVALCCSPPPEGRNRWTLRLLADKMVELEYVETVSHETVRLTLKKTNLSLGKGGNGVFHQKPVQNLSAKWKTS
jgi:transposase